MGIKMKFYLQRDICYWDDITLHMRVGNSNSVATSITFTEVAPGSYRDPLLRLKPDEAQELMDQLYAVGVRPSAAAGSAGQLEAVKYHLEDMRKLVFK